MKKKGIKLEKIISLYNQGLPPCQIAENLGCSNVNITRRLKKAGIPFKRDYSTSRRVRKGRYNLDENYFDTIDTEAKAYFLGLMYSDGSVSTKNFQFYIKLKDEDILIKFKNELRAESPIKRFERVFSAYIFRVSSKKLCESLIKWGCVPNKTRILQMPILKQDLYRHFIRGFYDGDGCLSLDKKIYHNKIDITCASINFLNQIRPYITAKAFTNGCITKEKTHDVWHLKYGGYQVVKILDWLYENSNYYLIRKFVKYQFLKNQVQLKQGELLGNPEVGNQQPSMGLTTYEGSETRC